MVIITFVILKHRMDFLLVDIFLIIKMARQKLLAIMKAIAELEFGLFGIQQVD